MKQAIINKLQGFFPAYPIEKAWVFGFYARGEETRRSDVDIMVKFDENARISLLDFVGVKLDLEDKLHKIENILQFTKNVDFCEFQSNKMLNFAVIKNIEIIPMI